MSQCLAREETRDLEFSRVDSTISTSKTWSSGRLLSRAQRDRKRLMNRASQSRRRQDLKTSLKTIDAHLSHIERRCLKSLPLLLSPTVNHTNDTDYTHGNANNTSLRDLLNEILGSVYKIDPTEVCRDDHFNQDVVIRGVILGWGMLQTQYFACPLWSILKRLDTLLFMNASVACRLACLRGIHLMLLSCRYPDNPPSLPPWFKPKDTQISRPTNIIVGYFAWPHFRQRLLNTNSPSLTNAFWHHFSQNVRFEWPLPPSHTIDMQPSSGKYHFTMDFRCATDSIQRFTMGAEFFDIYPDCYEDIQASYNS